MRNIEMYLEALKKHNHHIPNKWDKTSHNDLLAETKQVCNTLWIPEVTGNRTAVMNLNHGVYGFDEDYGGRLTGYNGNCSSFYVIIEVPANFDENHIEIIAEKMGGRRNIEADRIEEIEKLIAEMGL